ncbi:TetR family transcriptional regulator [Streptomyces sp. NPDC057616]|uniref:TetR family transcriptional regulator n=1 Tax=Streptomyces sp. NPDC057616 TaxID=3346183 RepID=UPI0036AFDCB8
MSKQERAERTRARLVQAAAEVFDERGLAAANMEAISRLAGVSKGALYFHFPSKEGLADAVRGACSDRFSDAAARMLATGRPAVQVLRELSLLMVEWIAQDVIVRAGLRLGRGQQEVRPAEAEPAARDFGCELQAVVCQCLKVAAERREVREGLPLQTCAWLVVGLLLMVERRAAPWATPDDLREFTDEAWAVLMPCISPDPGALRAT